MKSEGKPSHSKGLHPVLRQLYSMAKRASLSNLKELPMRRTIYVPVFAALVTLAAILAMAKNGSAADKPPKHDEPTLIPKLLFGLQSKPKPPATADKFKALGEHLGRALGIALEFLSGNQADLLSKNTTALLSGNSPTLLSGNSPALLSGNSPTLLSGNAPKLLSENQTPIFSGNKISLFSNIKVEIHIENSGNGSGAAPTVKPVTAMPAIRPSTPYLTPRPVQTYTQPTPSITPLQPNVGPSPPQEVEQPSPTPFFPPDIPSVVPDTNKPR